MTKIYVTIKIVYVYKDKLYNNFYNLSKISVVLLQHCLQQLSSIETVLHSVASKAWDLRRQGEGFGQVLAEGASGIVGSCLNLFRAVLGFGWRLQVWQGGHVSSPWRLHHATGCTCKLMLSSQELQLLLESVDGALCSAFWLNCVGHTSHGFNFLAWGRIVGDGAGGEFPEWTFGWYDSFTSKALLLALAVQCLTQAEVTALTASQLVDFWRPERCSRRAQKCSLVTWCSFCPQLNILKLYMTLPGPALFCPLLCAGGRIQALRTVFRQQS